MIKLGPLNFYLKILITVFLGTGSTISYAQTDSHYWTNQYGAQGLLLNGAVIAAPSGETSLFYNPGAMGMDDDLGFAFSFLTPTFSNLKTTNLIGDNNSITDRSISLAPGFLGVRFRPFNSKSITVGISKFKRFKTDINYQDRVISQVNGFDDYILRADLDFNREVSEDWYGIGLGLNLGDNIGIGVSQFSVWHGQDLNIDFKNEIVINNDPTSTIQSLRYATDYSFRINSGFITKLGISYKTEPICFGLTYTSPLYGVIYDIGSYNFEELKVNTLLTEFSSNSNRNDTRNIAYRTPHSVGLGIDIHTSKTTVSISSEYFTNIERYRIIDETDDSFDGQSDVSNETSFVVDLENEAVLNLAVGVQREFSEKATWVFGFRTDFNQNTTLNINNNPSYFGGVGDVFHLSGGTMLNLKRNQFSCGLDLGIGRRTKGQQLVDLSNITPSTVFNFSEQENVNNNFYSVMLFVTYDFIYKRFSSSNSKDSK